MAQRKLHNRHRFQSRPTKLNSESKKYMPLFGTWLIDLALIFGWHETISKNCWPSIFEDSSFCALTGLTLREDSYSDDEKGTELPVTTMRCRAMLLMQRKKLQKMEMPADLSLLNNIDLLGELLDLTAAEKTVLTFASGIDAIPEFRDAISSRCEKTTIPSLCQALGRITGTAEHELKQALDRDGILLTTGMLEINSHSSCDLEDKISLMRGLSDVMLLSHKSSSDLVSRFMKKAAEPTLTLENFPHLQRDTELLTSYLRNAVQTGEHGVNIMLYGKPGVGKNEFIQAMAKELQVELFEVSFADEDGDPIKGEARLKAYALCQKLLASNDNAMLLFDEIEDVFPGGFNIFSMFFGGGGEEQSSASAGKAWINRTMENNPVPAIWISNRVGQIDKSYLRRFDYSVSFPTPPHAIRVNMAEHHLGCFEPPRAWLEKLTSNEVITPAQFERAAKVARVGSPDDNVQALRLVEQTLESSVTLLNQKKATARNILRTGYSLHWLNTDMPMERLVERLKIKPQGTFCFYGAAGTGKSELARYMADQIGKPLVLKRASDILSKWVGGSEQNIARMFNEARQQDAVLVLDEADSFLADRRDAQRSWEVTQVNELLTQMEAFEGIFVCTTNLMNKLDQASLRRFAFKVRFDPLKPEQRVEFFRQELVRLGGVQEESHLFEKLVSNLEQLTPGDFAVAARQFELWGDAATPERLYEILKNECEAKGAVCRKIDFGV